MSKPTPDRFYVFELQEDGSTWAPAPGLYGGYRTAHEGLRAVKTSRGDQVSRVFKVARECEGRAVHVYRRAVQR
jgi:hypothetical protein